MQRVLKASPRRGIPRIHNTQRVISIENAKGFQSISMQRHSIPMQTVIKTPRFKYINAEHAKAEPYACKSTAQYT